MAHITTNIKRASKCLLQWLLYCLGLLFIIYQTVHIHSIKTPKAWKDSYQMKSQQWHTPSILPPSLPPLRHVHTFQPSSWIFLYASKQYVLVSVWFTYHYVLFSCLKPQPSTSPTPFPPTVDISQFQLKPLIICIIMILWLWLSSPKPSGTLS